MIEPTYGYSQMAKVLLRNGNGSRSAQASKYDAQNSVLSKTYGVLADLRRELSDSKAAVAEREELLQSFATCGDSQRAWLVLEDYFEKLSLSRRDFPNADWWPRLLAAQGKARLEEVAFLFLRAKRSLPTELAPYGNLDRFAQIEHAAHEQALVKHLEDWLFPPGPQHLDAPRASLRVLCRIQPDELNPAFHRLAVQFRLARPRTGEKLKTFAELADLTNRAAHEQELFAHEDWEFIQWLAQSHVGRADGDETMVLTHLEALHWLARWGTTSRLELDSGDGIKSLSFHGQVAELTPHLENGGSELAFTYRLSVPGCASLPLGAVRFFNGRPPLALAQGAFYLLRNAPPAPLLEHWSSQPAVPARRLSHRLLTHLRRTQSNHHVDWAQLCVTHSGKPEFIFELLDETVRLRLLAKSERDQSVWLWNGHEWLMRERAKRAGDKPELLDDQRLESSRPVAAATRLVYPRTRSVGGRCQRGFSRILGPRLAGPPARSRIPGQPRFPTSLPGSSPAPPAPGRQRQRHRLALHLRRMGTGRPKAQPRRLAPPANRHRPLRQTARCRLGGTGFRDGAVRSRSHGRYGRRGPGPDRRKNSAGTSRSPGRSGVCKIRRFPQAKALRERLKDFTGIPSTDLPGNIQADLRPYQKDGFDFLCHLTQQRLGGVLADDMGLGKTLQTLAWLAWLKEQHTKDPKPALVICPASVLHNWRREANRFTPHLKVLVLESGAARHNLRKQIPQNDMIVTNYALLRRDLEELQKFSFRAVILDEAQFIKNPDAQITQSVKQLKSDHRLALTGTPLENRLLDLWSIVDFVQPGYFGNQHKFTEKYEPRGENAESDQRIARRRLSAKLRPLLLRRLKKHVGQRSARSHRAAPRLRTGRGTTQTLPGRTAPQPRASHENRGRERAQ